MHCAHLLKLPLLAIAVPFFLTWAVLGVGVVIITSAAMFLRGACRQQQSAQAAQVTAKRKKCVSRCSPPRFLPVVLIAVGIFAVVANGVRRSLDVPSDPATVATELSTDEAERLLAEFTGEGRETTGLIPVTVPRETSETLPPAEPDLPPSTPTDELTDDESLNVTVFEPHSTDGTLVAELPAWTAQTEESDGLPRVIATDPNATIDDANAEAVSRLSHRLSEVFVLEHPEAAGWFPQLSDMRRMGVIGRRAIQQSEVTVGQFTEPVFQAFFEVVPPEDLNAQLFAAWRPEALKSRLLLVGGGIGLLTLLFGTLAVWLRIDDATQGKYRKQLGWSTAALWVVAGWALVRIAAGLALAIVA